MSVSQVELPEETMQRLEERAAAQNLDVQSWMREQIETVLLDESVASLPLTQRMDEALASGPPIVPDDQWWDDLERKALAMRDAAK